MRRGGFPPLRHTAEWYETRAEKRKTLLLAAALVGLFILAGVILGPVCNHGRC